MTERWKEIAGWPDYAVSDLGRVKRLTTRTCAKAGAILKAAWRGGRGREKGYLAVDLSAPGVRKRTFSVHVLVAEAFLGERPARHVPNHKDGDRANNAASNLEWATQSSNVKHAYESGLADARGERNGQAVLTEAEVYEIRRTYTGRRGEQAAMARRYGVSDATIRDVVKGKTWPHLIAA